MNFPKLMILSAAVFFISEIYAQKSEKNIIGIWLTEDKRAAVKIFKKENLFFGKIVWEKDPCDKNGNPNKDINNPDPKLRNKLLNGLIIMKKIKYNFSEKKGKGEIYNPENGKTYKINVELTDKNTLEVRGYIGIPLIGSTNTWKRIK